MDKGNKETRKQEEKGEIFFWGGKLTQSLLSQASPVEVTTVWMCVGAAGRPVRIEIRN